MGQLPHCITSRRYSPYEPMEDEATVEKILGHRKGAGGRLEFLTRWEHEEPDADSWEPAESFVRGCCGPWQEYIKAKGLEVKLSQLKLPNL